MRSVPDITPGPDGYRVWFAGQVARFNTSSNAIRYAAWLREPSGDNDNNQPMEKRA